MGEVSVRVNGRAYPVGCEDGQEQHVLSLARMFDEHVGQVARGGPEDRGDGGQGRLGPEA